MTTGGRFGECQPPAFFFVKTGTARHGSARHGKGFPSAKIAEGGFYIS